MLPVGMFYSGGGGDFISYWPVPSGSQGCIKCLSVIPHLSLQCQVSHFSEPISFLVQLTRSFQFEEARHEIAHPPRKLFIALTTSLVTASQWRA